MTKMFRDLKIHVSKTVQFQTKPQHRCVITYGQQFSSFKNVRFWTKHFFLEKTNSISKIVHKFEKADA